MLDDAVITIQYATSRGELWRWYWRAWARPRGLWRYHVFIAANMFLLTYLFTWQSQEALRISATASIVALALAVLILPLWPQLKFKPDVRTLSVNEQGIHTEIRGMQSSKSWREVRRITPLDNALYIEAADGNALIVPDRAFVAPLQFTAFVEKVRQWHSQGARGVPLNG